MNMGRELRRKEEKKNKKNNRVYQNDTSVDSSFSGLTLLKIIVGIAIILFVVYYFVAVFITKEVDVSSKKDNDTTENTTSSVSNKILAQRIFEQSEEEYFVYFYDFNEEDKNISSAISSKSEMNIYRVDTSSSLNRNYVTEDTGNRNVTGLGDLKVKNPTLIKISGDKVVLYLEGTEEIVNYLNS